MKFRKLLFVPLLLSLFACDITSDKNEGTFDYSNYYMFYAYNYLEGIEDYFGINDTETSIFTEESDFTTFQNKVNDACQSNEESYTYKSGDLFNQTVDFQTKKIAVTAMYNPHTSTEFSISSVVENGNKINQTFVYDVNTPSTGSSSFGFFYLILDKDNDKTIKSTFIGHENYDPFVCYKPVIYFYPEEEMDLTINYINKDNLLTTYPKYENGWNLHINEDGTFTSGELDRNYYALYFDEIANYHASFNEGFYVTKDNAISFLEEKLDLIGYTQREANEFIMYWLPVLEENEQSIVYFEQTEIRNIECPLEFSISPDTLIRNIIHIKKVNKFTSIKEQKLSSYPRNGFSVVEWGGVKY